VLARFDEMRNKLNHVIEYTSKLDLRPFMYPGLHDDQCTEFEFNAVSLHSGSCYGGHYTAYVKNEDGEYDCNDSSVHRTDI